PHCASVIVGPHGFGTIACLRRKKLFGDQIKRGFPACFLPVAFSLRSLADERLEQPLRMVDALSIAGDLGADDACRIIVGLGAVDATDRALVDDLDVERAS